MADGGSPRSRKKRAPDLVDFDCGADFYARWRLHRSAHELEMVLSMRLRGFLHFIAWLHDGDEADSAAWDMARRYLFSAGMTDPEQWPSWCFRRLPYVGDSEGMEQGTMFGGET
jgi:hypothetical protein